MRKEYFLGKVRAALPASISIACMGVWPSEKTCRVVGGGRGGVGKAHTTCRDCFYKPYGAEKMT